MSELERLRQERKEYNEGISALKDEIESLSNELSEKEDENEELEEKILSLEEEYQLSPKHHIVIKLVEEKTIKDEEIEEFIQENWEKLTIENLKAIV